MTNIETQIKLLEETWKKERKKGHEREANQTLIELGELITPEIEMLAFGVKLELFERLETYEITLTELSAKSKRIYQNRWIIEDAFYLGEIFLNKKIPKRFFLMNEEFYYYDNTPKNKQLIVIPYDPSDLYEQEDRIPRAAHALINFELYGLLKKSLKFLENKGRLDSIQDFLKII